MATTKTVGAKHVNVRANLPLLVHVSFLFEQAGRSREVQVFLSSEHRWQDFSSRPSFEQDRWLLTRVGPMVLAAYLGE
jgi:hypothetical protein